MMTGKDSDLLLKALSKMNFFEFVLHIGGQGKMLEDFKEMAASLGITDKCIFYGSVDPVNVPTFMANCDMFILPSRSESFGVVVIEAMASGIPVIASRCGGPEYLITKETGIIVEKENVIELRDAIGKLFMEYKRFDSKIIRQHANKWDYDSFTKQATKYYEEVIDNYYSVNKNEKLNKFLQRYYYCININLIHYEIQIHF